MAKKLPVQAAVCTECRARFEAAPKLTFLGLPRFSCPVCRKTFLHPMEAWRRRVYAGFALFFALVFVVNLLNGSIALPGFVSAGAIIALVKDYDARKDVQEAERRAGRVQI